MLGVADDCHAVHRWRDIPEQLQALAAELHRHERYAGHVAAWPRETVDEARRDRIGAHAEHDGDRQGEFVHLECGRPLRYDKVDGSRTSSAASAGTRSISSSPKRNSIVR